jgi:hypothetical protein
MDDYSFLMQRAGLIQAVISVWRLTVRTATPKVVIKARRKTDPLGEM